MLFRVNLQECSNCHFPGYHGNQPPPTKELWRSKREVNRGKSRQITANSIQKTMAITFLKNRDGSRRIATDRIVEVHPKKNGDHSGGEILAYFGVHHFCGRMTISFFNSRYRGGLGPGLYPTKPLSNFL